MPVEAFDCKARLATYEDVNAIVAFYEEHRSPYVYLRKREEIEKSVGNELFLIVENRQGELIAASGVYLLNDGQELPECILEESGIKRGMVAELGSVLRWEQGLPADKRYEGMWHPFLFSVPMVLLLERMRRTGLPIDMLVCDIQDKRTSVMTRLMGQTKLTPLLWKLTEAGQDLIRAFKASIRPEDTNVNNSKKFFRGEVGNLPDVAKYLTKVAKYGLSNRRGQTLAIDLTDLVERWTSGFDVDGRRFTILGRLIDNVPAIKRHGTLGWREFARLFNDIAPRMISTLNGAYQAQLSPPAEAFSSAAKGTTGDTQTFGRRASDQLEAAGGSAAAVLVAPFGGSMMRSKIAEAPQFV